MRASLLLWLLIATGCALPSRDGQFRCSDGRCPSGLVCREGRCRIATEADASVDASLEDGSAADAADAGDAVEVCAPSSSGPADEDLDGLLDEGCPFRVGPPHPLIEVHGTGYHFGPELSDGGTRLWLVSWAAGGLVVAERPSLEARFGAPMRVEISAIGAASVQLSTVTEDAAEVFLQVALGAENDIYHVVIQDGAASSLGSVMLGSGTIRERLGNLIHPAISRDGLHLAVVDGEQAIQVVDRPNRESPFGEPRRLVEGARFPVFAPDGTLFYTSTTDLLVHHVDATGENDEVTGLGERPHYHPATREVFFGIVGPLSPSGTEGVARAELCRTSAGCRAPICPDRTTSVAEGTHCFQVVEAGPAPDGACPTTLPTIDPSDRAQLATFHLAPEYDAMPSLLLERGLAWVGLRRTVPAAPFQWVTGEPISRPLQWGTDEPMTTQNCVAIGSDGLVTTDCAMILPVVCEVDRWPAWAPDGG